MSNTEPATPTMHSLNPKPLTVHGTGGTPFWSIGDVSLQGMGHLLRCPLVWMFCYPCPWTKLLPMCPDRTYQVSNFALHSDAPKSGAPVSFVV